MSTQDQRGVPVGVAHAQQQFRLLELPDSLLDLLASPKPPVLSIKSRPMPATQSASAQQEQASAVLCTSNKTYHLRQVHTSNSVHLTQPANLSAQPGISAIAKCGSVLEAHPVTESPVSSVREAITRIWHAENWDGDGFAQFSGAVVPKRKEDFFADIPFSDAECEQAWVELCAFEHEDSPALPTLPTLWTYWKTIFTTAVAEGTDLGAQFQIAHFAKTLEDEEGLLSGLVEAIFYRLLPDDQMAGDDWAAVDRVKCVPWVGRSLLAALDSHYRTARPTAEFLDLWRDALPEAWREDAQLEAIKGGYTLPSDHTIAPLGASTLSSTTASSDSSKGPRKWHERFKATRKQ
ncbi:sister chromatid cohesion protein dcc1 [Diplodia corticola]|uniref:Sister chromatid cohesion protein dcc1 n=1 Tax=Diplodia corticola TaxID=236234 RepID=A0A1J9S4C3_9PEZI|nr:sister chromatid cohesion protein dcc1 [Diplodia corticola]OJD34828.1 sister chromatid cohesion protein dcc1 [Diplodia corticola]